MHKLMPKFIQSSIISKKPGYLSEKLKTLPSWNFAHVSYLTMSTKGCSEFFLFCLDLQLLIKKCKKWVCRNQVFFVFANNSRSKQNNKKILNILLQTFITKKHLRSSSKNIELYVVGVCQSFQFFRQKT